MSKANSPRMRRINEAIKELVAERLPELKDPRIGFVTLTEVRTATDLGVAQVFVTVLPDDEDTVTQTLAGLKSASPLLRHEVGSRLRIKRVPDLHFVHDPLPAVGRRIDALLEEAQDRDADR